MPRRTTLLALLTSAALAVTGLGALPASAATSASTATDGPGALSHFGQGRKECVGTARNTTSKIWFTVANGVLSDVYAPTIDTTNVETMQLVVTDGATFTDLQTRDTTHTVVADPTGMSCTVTATARSGAYKILTTYVADPARASVVTRVQYVPLTAAARGYRLYTRLDASAGGNGGGGAGNGGADSATVDRSTGHPVPVTSDPVTTTNAANRDYARPSSVALTADPPLGAVSSGFVGTPSDGLSQLDTARTLTPTDTATGGNVVQTAALALDRTRGATVVVAVADTPAGAVATGTASLRTPFGVTAAAYLAGWVRYDAGLRRPSLSLPGQGFLTALDTARRYYTAANVVKASEDKTFPGAIVAGLGAPWGQSVSAGDPANTYFGSYREVFARDLYEAWTALYTDGDTATAQATVRFLLLRQQRPDGSMPRNSLLNGALAPDSFNTQLDETAYPILMAQQSGLGGDATLYPHVRAAADYLVAHGPASGVERWEEQSGYSPSTIAAEIAGLVAAGTIATQHGDAAAARVYLATADSYQRQVKAQTVTTTGPLSAQPYFLRLSKTGDPDAATAYDLGNGGPTRDQRSVVDAGFLELVRLGELPANDPDVVRSLAVVDANLERTTASGPGWLRYDGDGYGDCDAADPLTSCPTTGTPWAPTGQGSGHVWPVLTAERAQQQLATGDAAGASRLLRSEAAMSTPTGLVPEQDWDAADVPASPYGTDPSVASIGFTNGQPDGSAAPLTWGSASLVRLTADLTAGRSVDTPQVVRDRYVTRTQAATALTVTAPGDRTAAGATVAVTGTAAPGATVDVADVATDTLVPTTFATTRAGADGAFRVTVTPAAGTNALVVTATDRRGGTASTVRTVVSDVVSGTLLYDHQDPTGDDDGPGTYAYPTASAFQPGAYDLTDLQVYDTGSTVTFRVQTRDLTPTFGSPLGAQLLDIYVHVPGAGPTSTAAAYPSRGYTVAPADAWSRLIELQGFGSRFTDAAGTTLGQLTPTGNEVSRYITVAVPKAALGGTPGAGWGYTVTLAGQDGFSADQARAFTATPQDYTFGVCAAGGTSPICAVDPASVPKVLDTLTPDGVSQATELDPRAGTPVLRAVTQP